MIFGISCGQEFYDAAPRGPCFRETLEFLGGFGPLFLTVFLEAFLPFFWAF